CVRDVFGSGLDFW
nr:immunoglobulin heavy chain junction region [Macaca mulatta]MOX93632.1 immunoglobulin heavy chain junction region [Macaca mulatta]MOX93692.1 immunoglobulin heavy chain junction region [Macaca mulatta]MOX93790.1 immunoglobulin heavy chain junction region [Macaca mulatta]MOX93828.1 immunoglobulin heavy chain junction region [Macaca mulatta]